MPLCGRWTWEKNRADARRSVADAAAGAAMREEQQKEKSQEASTMKNNSLGTKLLMVALMLAVLSYFCVQAVNYFSDPLKIGRAHV